MEIKRDGILYGIAYGLPWCEKQPSEISLCKLFWRIPFCLVGWVFMIVIAVVALIGVSVAGFFVAKRLPLFDEDDEKKKVGDILVNFTRWPTLRGHRIYPIWVALIVIAIWQYDYTLNTIGYYAVDVVVAHWLGILLSLGIMVAFVFMVVLFGVVSETEAYKLTREYLKAVHEKVCPTVKVV